MRPVAPAFARAEITPHQITAATFVLAAAAAWCVAAGLPAAALALWIASRIGDGLDGVVARHSGRPTAFGGYLDITLDMAGYAAMVLGFAVLHPELTLAWTAVLAGYVVVITSTLALSDAARAVNRPVSSTDRTYQFVPALAEAGETTVMYTLWILLPAHVWWLAWVWVAALAITSVQRTVLAARLLR